MPAALAILLMSVTRSSPEFTAIMGGPVLMFPTAVFESQAPMITREAVDWLNKFWSLSFGISGPFSGFSGLRPREGPTNVILAKKLPRELRIQTGNWSSLKMAKIS